MCACACVCECVCRRADAPQVLYSDGCFVVLCGEGRVLCGESERECVRECVCVAGPTHHRCFLSCESERERLCVRSLQG